VRPSGEVDGPLLGDSMPMRDLRRLVNKFGPTSLPVLVTGPTGSGKGLVAKALHEASRRTGRYVVANMAAFGDGLLESELFGHVRGAFTNSTGSRRGLLLHADLGTIFLDEVHRVSAVAQPKLLRVLETQLVRPVGSDTELKSTFRVVSAANEDLEMLVECGRFQGDLLGRLSRLVITVPPLVDHTEDIPVLAAHFLAAMDGMGATTFTPGAMQLLRQYHWPRNVRELQAVVERASILSDGPLVDRSDILSALNCAAPPSHGPSTSTRPSPLSDDNGLAQRERRVIEALRAGGGKVRTAAIHLGISRKTLYRWLQDLGIQPPERRRVRATDLHRTTEGTTGVAGTIERTASIDAGRSQIVGSTLSNVTGRS
jgi:two-component system response regulator HydG